MNRLPLAALLALLPLAAQAQMQGIAYVQAPEAGWGVAMGATPSEAFALATEDCVETGVMAEDCIPMSWCQPAGWSIDLFVQHQEGPHWHEFHCGLPDRDTAEALVEPLCDRAGRPWLIECALVQVYDGDRQPQIN